MKINQTAISELRSVLEIHLSNNIDEHGGSVLLLLKEFVRRMFLWVDAVESKEMRSNATVTSLFDVAKVIVGSEVDKSIVYNELVKPLNLSTSYRDRLVFSWYINWSDNKEKIQEMGFDLPNPYDPYLEVVKRGGIALSYEVGKLEVYPFLGISVESVRQSNKNDPYISLDKASLDKADEAYKKEKA